MTEEEHWQDYGDQIYQEPRDKWTDAAMELEAQRIVKEVKEKVKNATNHNNRNS